MFYRDRYDPWKHSFTSLDEKSTRETTKKLDKAIKSDRDFALAYLARALIRLYADEFSKAKNDFDEALRIDSNLAAAYCGRGYWWLEVGNYHNAISDLTEALKLDSSFVLAHLGRGLAYSAYGPCDSAISDFDRVLAMYPEFSGALYAKALAYDLAGRFDEAVDVYQFFLDSGSEGRALWHVEEVKERLRQPREGFQASIYGGGGSRIQVTGKSPSGQFESREINDAWELTPSNDTPISIDQWHIEDDLYTAMRFPRENKYVFTYTGTSWHPIRIVAGGRSNVPRNLDWRVQPEGAATLYHLGNNEATLLLPSNDRQGDGPEKDYGFQVSIVRHDSVLYIIDAQLKWIVGEQGTTYSEITLKPSEKH